MDIQTQFISLASDSLDKQVHADIIAEHILHCKVQGHPTLGVRARTQKCLISWGLVRHTSHPPLLGKMKSIKMIILDRQSCRACAHLPIAGLGGLWSVLARVVPALVFALVVVVGVVCALAVVVVCAALIFGVRMALLVRMLCLRPMHMAGLLGGLLVRSLAVAIVPGFWLVLAVVCPLAHFTTMIDVVTVAPPAVRAPLTVRQAFEHIVVTSL